MTADKYIYDAMYDDYVLEKEWQDVYAELSREAVTTFTVERLRSYYSAHPRVAEAALRWLAESRKLLLEHSSAALVFAASALEVGLKETLLRPVVYGLVHAESVASLVAELTLRHTGFDRYRDLLFQILSQYGGVDLRDFSREGSHKTLWEEIKEVQSRRNDVLHRAEPASAEDAARSIAVASTVLEVVFPAVVNSLGLHLHQEGRLCNESGGKKG